MLSALNDYAQLLTIPSLWIEKLHCISRVFVLAVEAGLIADCFT